MGIMRTTLRTLALLAGLSAVLPPLAGAQELPPPPPLRVFLDCERCDFDHLRREVPVVDYMRDRMDADVHVLVTSQQTGGGGQEYMFHFLGLRELAHLADTLRYVTRQTDTDAEVRDGITRTFRLGLVRYLAQTARSEVVDVIFPEPEGEGRPAQQTTPADDPWNLWVFRASASSELSGETRVRSAALDGSFRASRTTEEFKIDVSLDGGYEEEEYEYSSGEKELSSETDAGADIVAVWSLGPHWSWGAAASAGVSTRLNQKLSLKAAPALEYSVYPYAESTRRQITVLYRVGVASYNYDEVTLYYKTSETRPEHSLEIAADFTQPWGDLVVSLTGSNYLDDFSKHRVDLFAMTEIRLFRGFNLNVEGSIARIMDQIYLGLEGATDEEVLLRRKELEKDFEYSFDVGFSFTFGSVFNNVVNPRIRTRGDYEYEHR